jgi:excisionase family DNA binding protein
MDQQQAIGKTPKAQNEELSVAAAAQVLQVTERTILNFIRGKQIRAVKVGKSWFVDKASVLALKAGRSQVSSSNAGPESQEHVEPVSEKTWKLSETKFDSVPSGLEKPRGGSTPRPGVRGLNCYRMAVDIFAAKGWGVVGGSGPSPQSGIISQDVFSSRIGLLQLQILEALGAGYHTFGAAKVTHYGVARSAAGSLLALISASGTFGVALEVERIAVEEKLLPALIALQRTAEKRGRS